MRFLNELHEGDRISGIYLCKQKQPAVTKNGKPYENIILQDKTGVMDGKIWDPNSLGIDDFDALDYIEVMLSLIHIYGGCSSSVCADPDRSTPEDCGSVFPDGLPHGK